MIKDEIFEIWIKIPLGEKIDLTKKFNIQDLAGIWNNKNLIKYLEKEKTKWQK